MNYRKLGKTGLDVSEIGFGAWGIGKTMWIGASDSESLAALRHAIDLGLNFIDTALAYGDGHSEKLVGEAVRASGKRVYIATKVPPKNKRWPARPGIGIEEAFPRDYVVESTETSLRNLGVEQIDVQQLHVWNPEWLASDEWRRALEDLKTSGKVKAVGISINDHQPDSALGIIETGLIDTVQVIYNIFDQTPASSLFPACVKHGVGVIVRVPFDEGALTGRITEATVFPEGDFRNHYFRDDRKKQVEERVKAIAADTGLASVTDVANLAMRYCLSEAAVSTVIPGMRSMSSVDGNVRASDNGPLDAAQLETLRKHAWDRNFYG